MIYVGLDSHSPAVGDMRIRFSVVKTGTVSLVGKQSGNEITLYKTSNGVDTKVCLTCLDVYMICDDA